MNHTRLYSPAAEHHCTLAGTYFPPNVGRRLSWPTARRPAHAILHATQPNSAKHWRVPKQCSQTGKITHYSLVSSFVDPQTNSIYAKALQSSPITFTLLNMTKIPCQTHAVPKTWRRNTNHAVIPYISLELNIILTVSYWIVLIRSTRTGFIREQIKRREVDDIDPARTVIVRLCVVGKAEVDHAQHLNALDVDRQVAELVGNERHELHYVVDLQQHMTVTA